MADWQYCGKFFTNGLPEFITETRLLNGYTDKEEWNNIPNEERVLMLEERCELLRDEEAERLANPDFSWFYIGSNMAARSEDDNIHLCFIYGNSHTAKNLRLYS